MKPKKKSRPKSLICKVSLAATLAIQAVNSLHADVKLPPIFSDHMVLQCDSAAPIWGTASPGEKVTVAFGGKSKFVVTGPDGKWSVDIGPLATNSMPATLTVSSSDPNSKIKKFDDVLVGEVWVGSGQSNMQLTVPRFSKNDHLLALAAAGTYPQLRMVVGKVGNWAAATPEVTTLFSAQLFYFGMVLQKELKVPVGLILGAMGGTPSGRWLTEEMFESSPACREEAAKADAAYIPEVAQKQYEELLSKWRAAVNKSKLENKPEPRQPAKPLPPREARRLLLGNLYHPHIEPFVPYGIRGVLWDQGESGTALDGVDQYTLMGALISGWRKAWGRGDFPFIYVQKPSGNGCAWDYSNPVTCKALHYAPPPATPPNGGEESEVHLRIMRYPNTAMAISSDLGPGIHPSNKSGYSTRDAAVALGMVYGRKSEYYGPVYLSHVVEGNKVRVRFSHTGKGLAFKNGNQLTGFAIAGSDNVFTWADAQIDGDTVVLSSPKVPQPVSARYGWGKSFNWANLFNQDGLPAIPFRTDNLTATIPSDIPSEASVAGSPPKPAQLK